MTAYPGYAWWDCDEDRMREDTWPFLKRMKGENREIAKVRLLRGVQRFIAALPSGWSVQWKVKRGHDLRVERSLKRIKVPFPRTYSGTAGLAVANRLATQIRDAELSARTHGGVPAYSVSAFGFPMWRAVDYMGAAIGPLTFHAYEAVNDRMWRLGATFLPYTRGVWKKAALAGAREMLRYLSSPHAWRSARQVNKGPILYRNNQITHEILRTIGYRQVLLDYLKANGVNVDDLRNPLPKRAKALMAKHVPTQP